MILSAAFEQEYSSRIVRFRDLREVCDPILESIAHQLHGSYGSRIKDPESLYSKIETGRFRRPYSDITDIYAATVALPVVSDIPKACERVLVDFEELERRTDRSNSPLVFAYDDLHLTVRLRRDNPVASRALKRIKFELQIKSLLQYAWTKATHETIYKGPEVSWQRDRLAAEARATLELIDSLLHDVSVAAGLQLEIDNPDYVRKRSIVSLLVELWRPEQRPLNLKRCAETIDAYLRLAEINPDDLQQLLSTGEGRRYISAVSLTPAQCVLATIIDSLDDAALKTFCRKARGVRFVVTREMQSLVRGVTRLPASRILTV